MKSGDIITCPHCGERTVVKTMKKFSGWQVTGEVLACALCSAELGAPEKAASGSAARDRLAALLGGDDTEHVTLAPGEEHRRGCRNCIHLLEHPFKLLCGRTRREVEPMHVCPEFQDREKKEEKAK